MALFDFLGLRKTLSDIRAKMDSIDAEIVLLEQRRAELVRLPLPFGDFVAWVCEQVDSEASGWPDAICRAFRNTHLAAHLQTKEEGYDATADFQAIYPSAGGVKVPIFNLGRPNSPVDTGALFWCLRDQIKAGVRSAMEAQLKSDWPSVVGTPRAERLAELMRIDANIERLSAEKAKISDEIGALSLPA